MNRMLHSLLALHGARTRSRRITLEVGHLPSADRGRAATVGCFCLALAGALVAVPVAAQQSGDVVFSGGFESPCGFESVASPSIMSVSLGAGSLGTEITIEGTSLGAPAYRAFLAGPGPGDPLRVELAVAQRQSDRIVAMLGAPLQLGTYDVIVATCSGEIALADAYRTPEFAPLFAQPGELITMTGVAFGSAGGTVFVEEPGGELAAGTDSWADDRVAFTLDGTHSTNGSRDLRVAAPGGTLQLFDALVLHGIADGDDEGPALVSAVATSNTSVLAQFSEAIVGGPDGAGDPTRYRITAPSRLPTVNVLAAEVIAPDFDTVRLTTMSQSDLVYTLEVAGIEDMAGNPLAEPTILVDPTETDFAGIPPDAGELVDSDGDGLSDAAEQRGWTVNVRRLNGLIGEVSVTSDPGDPRFPVDDPINVLARDTDGDGLGDFDEKDFGTNPRSGDTDADGLGDNAELNEIYSDPTDQDTDGDSYADGLEFDFFKTSPILADSDGDQLTDDVEISLGNRNPRVADLPAPTIEVGQSNLQLDVRFVESTSTSTNEIESRSVSSSLTQDQSRSVSNTNSNTQEAFAKLSASTSFTISGRIDSFGAEGTVEVATEAGWTGSWTSSHTAESTQATQRAYQDSLEEQVEVSEGATVSREVVGASMQITLALKSTTNLAYFLRNLQVTALKQDPRNPSLLTPIATLVPDAEPPNGYSLGPLSPERGPIILSSTNVFPQQVEDLMRNPRGLVFEISNFDIIDELGRNFAFTSQDIIDRTATLVIDNGSFDSDGDGVGDLTEYLRVATGSGRLVDSNGDNVIDENDRRMVFDDSGRQLGISLADALDAIGLERYREECPPNDDSEDCRPTSSLTELERANSYSVQREGVNGELERIFRIGDTKKDNATRRSWEVISPTGIEYTSDLAEFVLQPEADLKLAFVADIDGDRLFDGLEFVNNCSDENGDTDGDTLLDRFEVLIGWAVETGRGTRRVVSRCAAKDSDGDGLTDDKEAPSIFYYLPVDDDPQLDPDRCKGPLPFADPALCVDPPIIVRAEQDLENTTPLNGDPLQIDPATEKDWPDDFVTDPTRRDTDGDGIDDKEEVDGFTYMLLDGTSVTRITDPSNPDTDGDTVPDGLERDLGGDPRNANDVASFLDTDGDGLVGVTETSKRTIVFEQKSGLGLLCQTECVPGSLDTRDVTSNPSVADTDFDGLSDSEELALGTHPGWDAAGNPVDCTVPPAAPVPCGRDTDGDGLTDFQEVNGFETSSGGFVTTDPLDADTDNDKLTDGEEAELIDVPLKRWVVRVEGETPYRVYSDPTQPDADFDLLVDGDERNVEDLGTGTGTDPTKANTDGDVRDDYQEVEFNTNPLAEDFLVTVRYQGLTILEECEASNGTGGGAGEWFFDLGAITPSGTYQRSIRTSCDLFGGQSFPFSTPCVNAQPALGLPDCTLDAMGNRDPNQNLCYVRATIPDTIHMLSGTNLSLAPDVFETSFGVEASQEFALAGQFREGDGGWDPGSLYRLDDRFNETLMVDGNARSGFFNGSELSPGFITGIFEKPSPCSLELRVSILVE